MAVLDRGGLLRKFKLVIVKGDLVIFMSEDWAAISDTPNSRSNGARDDSESIGFILCGICFNLGLCKPFFPVISFQRMLLEDYVPSGKYYHVKASKGFE